MFLDVVSHSHMLVRILLSKRIQAFLFLFSIFV